MAQSSTITATVGLLDALIGLWPDLGNHLPVWVREAQAETAVKEAVAWATSLAAGKPGADSLSPRAIQTAGESRQTIFSQLGQPDPPLSHSYAPLQPLALTEAALFPRSQPDQGETAYHRLHEQIKEGLIAIQATRDPDTYLTAVFDLIRRYTYCLPNPYTPKPEPDTSLFDHSRVVAALAASYQPGTEGVLLINGDISGVQQFIYTITSRGALSGLRGRSLYLQLLTDAIAMYLCRRLELPTTSLIYASGGHFLLVAAPHQQEQVTALQRQISQTLLHHHEGALYLALGAAVFENDHFRQGQFGKGWQQLSQATSLSKQQRFNELDLAALQQLFVPQGKGGGEEQDCVVCHYEGDDVKPAKRQASDEEPVRKCALCHSLEELGKDIRNATHLLVTETAPQSNSPRTWQGILAAFGQQVKPVSDSPHTTTWPAGQRAVLVALQEPVAEDEAWRQHIEVGANFPVALTTRYVVNQTPLDEQGQIVTTTELEAKAKGINRVGVLRMDVDDLGDLFARGFKESSLVKTAALSQAVSLYFEGWVGQLCQQMSRERNLIYSIYSGGDDLFIIGAWDMLPDLAQAISRDLTRYAADNPAVHVSGGITLHGGKFPLYQMAQAADGALDAAKQRGVANSCVGKVKPEATQKNAITFLGRTLSWEAYEAVKREFERLLDLLERKAPNSLIQHLLKIDALYEEQKKEQARKGKGGQAVYWGPWHWHNAYQLTRMADRHKKLAPDITAIRDQLSDEGFSRIEQIGLAARWAQIYKKKNKSDQEEVSNEWR